MQLVNIGFGNIIAANKIVAIVSPESAPIKRMIQEAKDTKSAVDATCGRRTRAVLIMDSGHIILSAETMFPNPILTNCIFSTLSIQYFVFVLLCLPISFLYLLQYLLFQDYWLLNLLY